MGRLIRKISSDAWLFEPLSWLPPDEVSGRALADVVERKSNEVSLYRWDGEPAVRDRILAALAISQQDVRQLSYRVLEEEWFHRGGFVIVPTKGNTLDHDVNALHIDVAEITGQRALNIAHFIREAEPSQTDLEVDDVAALISTSCNAGYVTASSLHPRIKEALRNLL